MRGDRPLIVMALVLAAVSAMAQPLSQDNAQPPTPGQAEPPNPPKSPDPTPPSVTIIDSVDAQGILGRDVRSPADENMGRIADVVVDRAGQVRAAVIDFGGFLGVGSRKIAVDWSALHFARAIDKGDRITLELTRDQVNAAPEYKEGKPVVVLGASGSLEPLRFPPTPPEK
jgi:hypothetical protein